MIFDNNKITPIGTSIRNKVLIQPQLSTSAFNLFLCDTISLAS